MSERYTMSSAEMGLVVVFEGKRTRVRVFRRFFYPVQARDENVNVVVYSDTGQEREVTYRRADEFGLDDPFKLSAMIRLCKSSELIGPDAKRDEWMPFDPTRIRPLDERIRDAKKKARWRQRLRAR